MRNSDERWLGLFLSLLLHVAAVLLVLSSRQSSLPEPQIVAIDVSFESPKLLAKQPQRQIVSPSEQPETKPPEASKFEADRNSSTEREQIRRGTEGDPNPRPKSESAVAVRQPAQPVSKSSKPAESKQKAEPPKKSPATNKVVEHASEKASEASKHQPLAAKQPLGNLLLDNSTLAKKFGKEPAKTTQQPSQIKPGDLSSYQAFSRPQGSGASFMGTGGVSDHLPNLPDGDITLLNAKASTYAGFVRRVAIQVFAHLRSQGWEQLSRYEIRQMTGFSTIEAVMSSKGTFISARLLEHSGSPSFDSVLNQAVSRGARDPNPPAGAQAADGNIHFIFKARSWAETGSAPRTGAPIERRWLLLATGLE